MSVEQFVDLNFNGEFLRVAGDMTATVDGFVYASGSLALEKKGAGTVSVKPSVGAGAATPQAVDLLTLGGTVDLFAGVNAPQDIATLDPADPGATKGLLVQDAQFGLALLNASVADQTYTVVHNGTSNTVTFDPPLPASQSVDSVTLEQSSGWKGSR